MSPLVNINPQAQQFKSTADSASHTLHQLTHSYSASKSAQMSQQLWQSMMDCNLKQQADNLKQVTEPNQNCLAQLNQRVEISGKSGDIWLNKLRPVSYTGTADGTTDPWIKHMDTYLHDARIDDSFIAGIILNLLT